MSIVSTKATEQSLQSFLERITQIETKRCKDETPQSESVEKQIDCEAIDENKSHLQQHLKPWSTIKKSCQKDIFEKKSDLRGNICVQWTLEHAVAAPKHAPSTDRIVKPLEVPFPESECACVEQQHVAAQSVHDHLYEFEPQLKDAEQILPSSCFYIKDNQQDIVKEIFYHQQQVPFLEKPESSYQSTWRSESYPFQQSQEQTRSECCETIGMSDGESSRARRQLTLPSSRRKSHAAEPSNAYHPPPPPLQLRQRTKIFPLEKLPPPKQKQLLPSKYKHLSLHHVLPASQPLTPVVVSPVVNFVTPGHEVSSLHRMPSSDEEMEQNKFLQQYYRQLHEHQSLQFQDQYHYQQELFEYQQKLERGQHCQLQHEMYYVQDQQHYQSQIQQPFQQQHFDYEQSQQQNHFLLQQHPDETICVVERIYFSSPENESEEITKTLSVIAPQQTEEESQPDVAYSTPFPNRKHLLQKQESPGQYDKKHSSFEVASENENEVSSHLHLQEIEPNVNDFPDVDGKSCYKFHKAHGDQLNTLKDFQTPHELLKQEASTNSSFKKTQLRCSTKARKRRLQRESIIRGQSSNHNDTDFADKTNQNACFHSPPGKKQSLNTNSKDAVVEIAKRDASTQANIGCCCINL